MYIRTTERARFARQIVATIVGTASLLGDAVIVHSQQVITPNKVQTELYLDQGNEEFSACGIHWADIVLDGKRILAYETRIIGWFIPKTHQSTTMVYGSIRITTVHGDETEHVDVKPSDLYLIIEQDPATYRIDPLPNALPANVFGGVIAAGGKDGDSAKALAPTMALLNNKPMLVYFVFDDPLSGKQTRAIRVVNDLPRDQESALADCLARAASRSRAKPGGAPTDGKH